MKPMYTKLIHCIHHKLREFVKECISDIEGFNEYIHVSPYMCFGLLIIGIIHYAFGDLRNGVATYYITYAILYTVMIIWIFFTVLQFGVLAVCKVLIYF